MYDPTYSAATGNIEEIGTAAHYAKIYNAVKEKAAGTLKRNLYGIERTVKAATDATYGIEKKCGGTLIWKEHKPGQLMAEYSAKVEAETYGTASSSAASTPAGDDDMPF